MDGYRHDFDRRKGAENLLGNDRSQPLDKLIAAVLDDVLNPSIDDTVVDGLVKGHQRLRPVTGPFQGIYRYETADRALLRMPGSRGAPKSEVL